MIYYLLASKWSTVFSRQLHRHRKMVVCEIAKHWRLKYSGKQIITNNDETLINNFTNYYRYGRGIWKATDLDENSCLLCGMSWRNMPWRCWHYASSMFQSSYGVRIRIILKMKMAKAHHYKEDSQHTRFSLFWIWKHKWFNIMLRIECEPWMHVPPMV